ncbi:MAG: hypothetical protein Q7J09_07855 [Methanocalculus sp.]|uniref:hypothetical protein n=1 Tax=Methanocalculus sp. TaxID=2004547 RepID=UPI00271F4345|nr:hypothetical protein [Methanocalculus sp.]MDO9539898.1 hypothetical protein [Methanocalculus sp.]
MSLIFSNGFDSRPGRADMAGMDVKKMNRSQKLAMLAGLMVLLVFVAPSVSAFEISGTYTEEGQKWLNEHWGEEITLGELAKIAYTEENYEKIKANVDAKLLEDVWSQPYFWGDRYPPEVVTPGPKIFDENSQPVDDPDGSILAGIMDGSIKSLRSGIVVTADPVSYSGGYIRHGGSGYVYGEVYVGSLRVESQLHGNGDWLSTSYNVKYGYDNDPRITLLTSGARSPVHDTLYQSQTVAQSTNPTASGSTWSPSYYYS